MSILNNVKNYIEKDLFGINRNTKVKSAQKIHEITPDTIIETQKTEENNDTITIKNNNTTARKATTHRTVGQIRETIRQKCQANNINFAIILKNLPQVAGLSKEKFASLSDAQQERVLLFLEKEVDHIVQLQKQFGSSKETNTEEIITESAKNKYEAQQAGVDVVKVEEKAGNINEELGKDFKKLSIEEKRAKFNKMAKSRKEAFERELQQKLLKVPEQDRKSLEQKLRAEHEYAENVRFNEIIATQDSDTALEAVRMQPAKYMATSVKVVLKTRSDQATKTSTADKISVDYSASLMESYAERGDKPSSEVVTEYTCCAVSAKSADGVRKYQKEYADQRRAFENGENTPSYLNKEYFTSTAKGIGEGALANTNMSADEKASFIADWKDEAKQHEDYEVVTQSVDEILATKEYKEIADKIKTISNTKTKSFNKVVKNDSSVENPEGAADPEDFVTEFTPKFVRNNQHNNTENKNHQTGNTSFTPVSNLITKNIKNRILISEEIKTISMNDAIKKFGGSAVIETVLDNPNLKHMRPLLATIIKGYDLNAVKKLAHNCSTSSFLYICSIVNEEFVSELKDERKDLCYSARKQLENMEKQYA